MAQQIRPITELTREEVADLARNAADNSVPLRAGNVFEPGTWQFDLFNREWVTRRRELVEDAA